MEHVSGPASASVDEVGVAPVRFADSQTERLGVGRGHDEVDVVRHEAIGPHLRFVFTGLLGEEVDINSLIAVLEEDGFASVATLGDVVSAPGNYDSRKPWHARKHSRK